MTDKEPRQQKPTNPDWFVRGALTRVGEIFDGFLGRNWTPTSSLATSELIERIKRLMDAEARPVAGKGRVVPHHLQLRVEWNKFSTDSEHSLENLRNELLAATVDHINDSLYYTYAPVEIEIKPDYFIEGVKLHAGFDGFEKDEAAVNVTVPSIDVKETAAAAVPKQPAGIFCVTVRFMIDGVEQVKELFLPAGQSISVGRIAANEILIDSDSVSKTHASLSVSDSGKLSIADTGSTNGTFVNDERMAYGKASELVDGDRIKFGAVEVIFAVRRDEPGLASQRIEDTHQAETVEIEGLTFTSRSPIDGAEDKSEAGK